MYLWIAVGSALGGMARYWCSGNIVQRFGATFPWDTLFINVLGSFIIGLFAAVSGSDGRLTVSPQIRQFVMVGLCGGYTTFSSFSLQTLTLFQEGAFLKAGSYILLSVFLCLFFVWLGYLFGTCMNPVKGVL